MPLRLRAATLDDLDAIQQFDEFNGDRRTEIEQGHCLVAILDDSLVGYGSVLPRALLGEPMLTYLCVREQFRRQGVGTALVRGLQARAAGRKLLSSTEAWCVGTQRVFERLGWQRVGEIRGVNRDGSAEWFYAIDLNGALLNSDDRDSNDRSERS